MSKIRVAMFVVTLVCSMATSCLALFLLFGGMQSHKEWWLAVALGCVAVIVGLGLSADLDRRN